VGTTFTITTTEFPIVAILSSAPPAGLTLTDNHDGTVTLSGPLTVNGTFTANQSFGLSGHQTGKFPTESRHSYLGSLIPCRKYSTLNMRPNRVIFT
jgi:hypothetical protein